LHKKIVVRIW